MHLDESILISKYDSRSNSHQSPVTIAYLFPSLNVYCLVKRRWRDQYQKIQEQTWMIREISEIAESWTIAQRAISRETREKLATIVNSRVHKRYARAPSFLPTFFSACLKLRDRTHMRSWDAPFAQSLSSSRRTRLRFTIEEFSFR